VSQDTYTEHGNVDAMGLFRSSELLGIAEETLEFVLRASEDTHPDEYMGFLRAEEASRVGLDRDGDRLGAPHQG